MSETCRICGEPKSAHVATEKGPFTHPREARGEGTYVRRDGGTVSFGVSCRECGGPCDGHEWERYEFVPIRDADTIISFGGLE